MKIHLSGPFLRQYKQLEPNIQLRADKILNMLALNLRHPSLEARIVDKRHRIWKAKVTASHRLTYQIEDGVLILRRIGSHNAMERPTNW